jgi:enoyl-CoA hydratase/carnithine racemase
MSEVTSTRDEGILELRLNRPQKKNALSSAMYESLAAALTEAGGDESVRVVLLAANGDAFSSGNDVGDFMRGAFSADGGAPSGAKFLRALATFDKPIVAAVGGVAVGIGTTMLLHCDFVLASKAARFRTPFVDLGLVPEAASSLLLPQRIGHAAAREMMLFGTFVEAARAYELGLVNEVVEPADLDRVARMRCRTLAEKPAHALRATKALLRGDTSVVLARIDEELHAFGAALASPEAQAALFAFLESRAAQSPGAPSAGGVTSA